LPEQEVISGIFGGKVPQLQIKKQVLPFCEKKLNLISALNRRHYINILSVKFCRSARAFTIGTLPETKNHA
jgi:hypothetical protein